MPPPAAPHAAPSFQTCSDAGWVAYWLIVVLLAAEMEMHRLGSRDGLSTDRTGLTGEAAQERVAVVAAASPAAEKTVCPWAAAC